MIVNLLTCPVSCFSSATNAVVGEDSAAAASVCCSRCDEVPVSETPEPCENDCNCQNCVCEGAVIEAAVELPDPGFLVSWLQPILFATHSVAGRCDFSTRRSFAPAGQLLCGRDRCVAHQSWLI
ncbi:MAG TPA: hypothetical protein DDZ51_05635 [Planctomycetaceae bacterium]|nr:hypothetical protein [Planctomycetaceae bacterium]